MDLRMPMVKLSKRSWWAALYRDGRQLFEWGTLVNTALSPLGLGRTSRWEEVSKEGMVSVRLLCPDGQIGELWGEPYHFFQLKSGIWVMGEGQDCDAHLIGVVREADGTSECYAWVPQQGQLLAFQDNIYHMQFQHMGPLALGVQGLRV